MNEVIHFCYTCNLPGIEQLKRNYIARKTMGHAEINNLGKVQMITLHLTNDITKHVAVLPRSMKALPLHLMLMLVIYGARVTGLSVLAL